MRVSSVLRRQCARTCGRACAQPASAERQTRPIPGRRWREVGGEGSPGASVRGGAGRSRGEATEGAGCLGTHTSRAGLVGPRTGQRRDFANDPVHNTQSPETITAFPRYTSCSTRSSLRVMVPAFSNGHTFPKRQTQVDYPLFLPELSQPSDRSSHRHKFPKRHNRTQPPVLSPHWLFPLPLYHPFPHGKTCSILERIQEA